MRNLDEHVYIACTHISNMKMLHSVTAVENRGIVNASNVGCDIAASSTAFTLAISENTQFRQQCVPGFNCAFLASLTRLPDSLRNGSIHSLIMTLALLREPRH